MKPGEARFRAALQRWRWSSPRLPQLTPAQWFRLAILVLGLLATALGIEGEVLRGLVEVLLNE